MGKNHLSSLLDKYRSLVLENAELSDTVSGDPKKANAVMKEIIKLIKKIKTLPNGREEIANFMKDSNPAIRLSAAAASLGYMPEQAVSTLQGLIKQEGFIAIHASTILKGWEHNPKQFTD